MERLARMRRSFAKDYSILADDYEYFTRTGAHVTDGAPLPSTTSDASTHPSKAPRKSAPPSGRRSPRRS
jgi:hypothetical protein